LAKASTTDPTPEGARDFPAAGVSVVIPAFNAAAFLPKAIESALDQSLPPAEVIVVDDGSTDGTAAVMASFGSRICCAHQPNRGVSAARNAGLAMAGGTYVAFLDADDYFLPRKLAAQTEILQSRPKLSFVSSGWRLVDEQGRTLRDVEPWHEAPRLDLLTWLQWKPVFPGALLFRRQSLAQAGGFDPALKHAEDVDLVLRMARLGHRADWLRSPTVCYRQHAANATRAKADQAAGILAVLASFFAQPDLPRAVRRREAGVRYSTLLWTAWELFREGSPEEAEEYLRQSRHYARTGPEDTALGWAGAFARFARRERRAVPDLTSALPLFQASASTASWSYPLETAIRFRLAVVEPFFAGVTLPDYHTLAEYHGLSARQVAKTVQGTLASSAVAVHPARISHFWSRMVASGVVPQSEWREVTTLYLTLFARTAFAFQAAAALRSGWHALRVGAHPRALPAWGRFLRSAIRFAFRRTRGDSTAAIWSDGEPGARGTPAASA